MDFEYDTISITDLNELVLANMIVTKYGKVTLEDCNLITSITIDAVDTLKKLLNNEPIIDQFIFIINNYHSKLVEYKTLYRIYSIVRYVNSDEFKKLDDKIRRKFWIINLPIIKIYGE